MVRNTTNPLVTLLSVVFVMLICIGCDDDNNVSIPEENIYETLQRYDELDTFTSYLEEYELADQLTGSDNFTLFPPTDEAFENLPERLDTLSEDRFQHIVEYHIHEGYLHPDSLEEFQEFESTEGSTLFIEYSSDNSITINDRASVVMQDLDAYNGILNAVDEILVPDEFQPLSDVIAKRYSLSTMEQGLHLSHLLDNELSQPSTSGYTVFAATETSFEEFDLPDDPDELNELMEYHVVDEKLLADDLSEVQSIEPMNGGSISVQLDGDTITLNGNAEITTSDIEGTNGVVHLIDTVLDPSSQ
ncbi:MAG: fasciclin domain-containing protein [Balneolaceae bacterium]|nr:fasciclin domain-containing protein [Balneolaceae bacterium]